MTDIIIPVVLSLTLGVLISIYTGLVASRTFAFFQARYKALAWVYGLNEFWERKMTSVSQFNMQFSAYVFPIMLEFRALGHERGVCQIGGIYKNYQRRACELTGVEFTPFDMPKFSSKDMSLIEWLDFEHGMLVFQQQHFPGFAARVAGLRPSYWSLFLPIPFPNYATYNGQLLGLFVKRRSGWTLFWAGGKMRVMIRDEVVMFWRFFRGKDGNQRQ